MKSIYLASMSALMLLTAVGCSEKYDIYPEEYNTILMFKDSGKHDVRVYSTQDLSTFPLTIMKGGLEPSTSADVRVRAMTPEEFQEYVSGTGDGVSYMPADCYSIGEGGGAAESSVHFDGSKGYANIDVQIYPKKVGEYLATLPEGTLAPAIGLVLVGEEGQINNSYKNMLIVPDYSEPVVGFIYDANFQDGNLYAGGAKTVELKVGLPFESEWDFNVDVEVDPSLANNVNNSMYAAKDFEVAPEGSYSFNGKVAISKGATYGTLKVTFDPEKLGTANVLPLRLTGVDMTGLKLQDVTAVVFPDMVALSTDNVSSNDVITWDGQGIEGLIGMDPNTFAHSDYYYGRDLDDYWRAYVQVILPNAVNEVTFDWMTRGGYGNGIVRKLRVTVESNGQWLHLGDVDTHFNARGQIERFGPFKCDTPFNNVVISILEADGGALSGQGVKAFWSCSGINVFGK